MFLFLGSFQILPLFLVLIAATAGALVAGVAAATLGIAIERGDHLIGTLVALLIVLLLAGEALVRARARRRRTGTRPLSLEDLALATGIGPDQVGEKARRLADLTALGLPIPPGLALPAPLCRRALAEGRLPAGARFRLKAFLRRCPTSHVVVRSSFTGEDGARLYAGVYLSIRDVSADDLAAVEAALARVLASATAPAALAYRRRHDLAVDSNAAVLVQAQIAADQLGVIASRGLDGRGDRLPLEMAPPDHAPRAFAYDVLDRTLHPLDGTPPSTAPRAIASLADRVLGLEHRLEAPVHVEFALLGEHAWIVQLRPLPPLPSRTTWIDGGPVDLGAADTPPLLEEIRGGLALLARGLDEGTRALGLDAPVGEGDLALFDGRPYLDLAAWRRIQGAILGRPVARALLRQLRALVCGPPPVGPAGDPPRGPRAAQLAWTKAGAEAMHLAQARVRATLGLARSLRDTLEDSGAPLVRAFARRLDRRMRRLRATRARLRHEIEGLERGWVEATLRAVLPHAPGADARDLPFAREDEVRALLEGRASGPPLVHAWRARRAARDQAGGSERSSRRWDPALPTSGEPLEAHAFAGIPLAPGPAEGCLIRPDEGEGAGGSNARAPTILLLPDGSPAHLEAALAADAVILTGGGVLSHVALGLVEAGIPSLVCTDPDLLRLTSGTRLRLDGARGVVVRAGEAP